MAKFGLRIQNKFSRLLNDIETRLAQNGYLPPMDMSQPTDQTQDWNTHNVKYRCACGEEFVVNQLTGGDCPKCQRTITAKALQSDLAMTMTISNLNSETPTIPIPDSLSGDDDLLGATLGHFELGSKLGGGGMGHVYRALDKSLQRYVAVKVLRHGSGSMTLSGSSSSRVDDLLQEAVTQARVTHPNIVTIYYVGKQDGNPFLAMELVHGRPLSQINTEYGLEFATIGPIALQIAEALEFSHQLDIIHGDIKPSNIILQPSGQIKLSDFGMARRASDPTSGKIGGTPNYLAPELLKGEKPSVQSDMYALGVTLYELSFGRIPVQLTGKTVADWLNIHQQTEIVYPTPWPDHLPDKWKKILVKLLHTDPAQRYRDYSELIDDLESIQPGSRINARRVPRFIAAGIDYLLVGALMISVGRVFLMLSASGFILAHPYITTGLKLATFIPMLAYTIMLIAWRQSIGRALMHVRVVNQYEIRPSPRNMVIRSIFRMAPLWGLSMTQFLESLFTGPPIRLFNNILIASCVIYVVLSVAYIIVRKTQRTPHDIAFRTNVVVDTD